jgi:hypothetical protein
MERSSENSADLKTNLLRYIAEDVTVDNNQRDNIKSLLKNVCGAVNKRNGDVKQNKQTNKRRGP